MLEWQNANLRMLGVVLDVGEMKNEKNRSDSIYSLGAFYFL